MTSFPLHAAVGAFAGRDFHGLLTLSKVRCGCLAVSSGETEFYVAMETLCDRGGGVPVNIIIPYRREML